MSQLKQNIQLEIGEPNNKLFILPAFYAIGTLNISKSETRYAAGKKKKCICVHYLKWLRV